MKDKQIDEEKLNFKLYKENSAKSKIYTGIKIFFIVLTVFVIGFLSFIDFYPRSSSEKPSKIDAFFTCKEYVKNNLKAPATADFQSYYDAYVKKAGQNKYEILSYVDAQNSFGAKLRTRYICDIKYVGNDEWELEKLSFINQ